MRPLRCRSLAVFMLLSIGVGCGDAGTGVVAGATAAPRAEASAPAPIGGNAVADFVGSPRHRELVAALEASSLLSDLSGGEPFVIDSSGPWSNEHQELVGLAALISFGRMVTLAGNRPVIATPNAVSEQDQARGIQPAADGPDRVFSTDATPVTATRFSVLVDLAGVIREVMPAPEMAPPPAPDAGKDVVLPGR
jgi:hypothetical protein